MATHSTHEVTGLLQAWGRGDEEALQKLMPLVYRELRQAARRYMAGERSGHLLQTTALVNETYLRLVGVQKVSWQNRAHFFAERKSRVVELRFFGGLTVQESAEVLNVSQDTVMRDWKIAKVWLLRELNGEGHRGG